MSRARLVACACAALVLAAFAAPTAGGGARAARRTGIHKIRHVIVIMQENRSFDSYFGTFPGANGIPRKACVPNGIGGCARPLPDPPHLSAGGAPGPPAGMRAGAGRR